MTDPVEEAIEQGRRFDAFVIVKGGPLLCSQVAQTVQNLVMQNTYEPIFARLYDGVLHLMFRTLPRQL